MLALRPPQAERIARRDFLHVGALGFFGLTYPALVQAVEQQAHPASRQTSRFGCAKRCLLLFLTGGPPHQDTWDLKPAAPEKIRGELKPIASKVPGLQLSELFPKIAQRAHHLCVIRPR
jgi:hypothetical protein